MTAKLEQRLAVLEAEYSLMRDITALKEETAQLRLVAGKEEEHREKINAVIFNKIDVLDSRVRAAERLIAVGIGISIMAQVALGIFLALYLGK